MGKSAIVRVAGGILGLILLSGCGVQHVRFEDKPTGFDDLVYLLEPALKLYDVPVDDERWDKPYQYAPVALAYTGPEDSDLEVKAGLEIYSQGTNTQTSPVEGFSFERREQELQRKDGSTIQQRLFYSMESRKKEKANVSDLTILRFSDFNGGRTRYFHAYAPKESGFQNGRWYRLTLGARIPMEKDDGKDDWTYVAYDFYVSQSNTIVAFSIGTVLVIAFSALGL